MSWKDQLQQGKFRNAEFIIRSDDMAFGRRTELHEFPLRDVGYAEDLGRKQRGFNIQCYVIGPDYMTARDSLIDALEQPGPGTLVHPYMGSMRVSVLSARKSESTRNGGMAMFSIQFVEAGENIRPDSTANTAAQVDAAADVATEAVSDTFADNLIASGLPEFVRTAAVTDLSAVTNALNTARLSLQGDPTGLAGLAADISGITNSLASLILQPAALGVQILGAFRRINIVADRPSDALSVYSDLFDHGEDAAAVPTSTPSRRQQASNQVAIHALARRAAVIESARASAAIDYDNYSQAIETRDLIADQLDLEMDTADDATYQALADLRACVIQDIAARGAKLPKLVSFTPKGTLPALVIAHQVYGHANRDSDLIQRNPIRHPGFVTGGQALEVLSDG